MRILICNYEYPPLGGGGGVITALMAEELARRHEVTVLTSQGFGTPHEGIENGVRVLRVPVLFRTRKSVASIGSMAAYVASATLIGSKLVRAETFHIVNTQFVLPTGPVGHALATLARVPNVLVAHGGDLYDPSKALSPHRQPLLRAAARWLIRRADVVVGQSRHTLANLQQYFTPDVNGVLIPLAIRRPHVEPAQRATYGLDDDEIVLVTVGRLIARKNISQLVQMMERFRGQKVRLLVIGSGPLEGKLQQEVNDRQLQSQICFPGFVSETEKFKLLALSDLFVSTSLHEGFGLVFLEAMSCGLPVITYDCGGQVDFLQSGKTGFLAPVNRLDLFTECCRLLVENSDLRRQMADGNRKRVEEFYIERYAIRFEDLFRATIELRRETKAVTAPHYKAGWERPIVNGQIFNADGNGAIVLDTNHMALNDVAVTTADWAASDEAARSTHVPPLLGPTNGVNTTEAPSMTNPLDIVGAVSSSLLGPVNDMTVGTTESDTLHS
jgi:glycosyltransferase involved in cell wall biosynthesis